MTGAQRTIHALYKKLLTLYPRGFRERLEESMEQTFKDLYKEQQTKRRLFDFVFWIFAETSIGIIQEHILLIKETNPMKNILTNFKLPAIISSALVLPFIIMELVNRRNFNEGFPFPLFGFLWVLPILFILTLTPMVQTVRAGNSLVANPISLLFRVAFLLFIAWFWASIMIDQMPCFLGVPNCD